MERFAKLLHYLELDSSKVNHLIDLLHHTCNVSSDNASELKTHSEVLDWLLRTTQKFWLRAAGKERWEINDHESWASRRSQLLSCLEELGFTQSITPREKFYDHAMLLSAVAPKFEKRLQFFSDLLKSGTTVRNLFLVGGSRKLLPTLEQKYINILGQEATELDMLNHLTQQFFENGLLPENLKVISVDTPIQKNTDGTLRRPNTEDTIYSWLIHEPAPGSVLCVSCQPYVKYQGAIVKSVLLDAYSVDSVGAAINSQEKISVILDSFARYIYTMNKIMGAKAL